MHVSRKKLKTQLISLGMLFFTGVVFTWFAPTAAAATPPDTCFAFSAGTITDYYNNEGNNSGNPTCPRDVDIPSNIGGLPVTTIGTQAFFLKGITAITLPSSVTTIQDEAFSSNQIASLTIPSSVTSIGVNAFGNNQLTSVTIPNSVTSIGTYAFSNNQLTSVTIPSSVISLGVGAFYTNLLTSITIPSSITAIDEDTFSGNRLTSLTIPNGVTTIRDRAFSANELTQLNLPNSITTVGSGAFNDNQLTSVAIPNGLTTLDSSAFSEQHPGMSATTYTSLRYSANPADRQQALDALVYAALTTPDGTNTHSLEDAVNLGYCYIDPNSRTAGDENICNFGGHLINPAKLVLSYTSEQGSTIVTGVTIAGELDDATVLSGYSVYQGPFVPVPADIDTPTPTETQAVLGALDVYYRMGQTVSVTAPTIPGYITPNPATQTYVLGSATTMQTVAYTTASTANSHDTGAHGNGGLANTGSQLLFTTAASVCLLIAAMWVLRMRTNHTYKLLKS